MDKTLKEIAEELKIDKQKVYRFVKSNHINESHHDAHQNGSLMYFDDVAQNLIKQHFFQNEPHQKTHHEVHQNHINDALYDALVKQLEVKDKQITELQKLVDQEQQLRMVTEQKLLSLEDKKTHWWNKKQK